MPNSRSGYALTASPLYKLRSRSKLAKLLNVTNAELRNLSRGDALYREFDLPKKTGGLRHVENPARPLKLLQARLSRLLARVTPPDYLYCPVKGRCYVSNAARHLGNRVVRSLDIKKFFPNTTSRRVFWFFHKVLQCEVDIAGLLTRLATYQGHLPTGSPLSPIVAYFAHFDMWEDIAAVCATQGLVLTVYVDDCTISGDRVTDHDMWLIKQAIHRTGLRYHKEKAYFQECAEITGTIVRDGKIMVPNRQFRKLKAAKQALYTVQDTARTELENQISGLQGQIRQVAEAGLPRL